MGVFRQITMAPICELRTGRRALREIIAGLCSVTRGQRHLSTDSRLLAGLAAGHL